MSVLSAVARRTGSVRVRTHASTPWPLATGFLLWAAISCLLVTRVAPPGYRLSFEPFTMVDFRDSVWIPVHDFVHGGVPWDRASFGPAHPEAQFFPLYLPHYWYPAALLLVLPYRVAALLWMALLVATLVWLVETALRQWAPGRLARRPWLVAVATAASLALRPVQTALSQGNWAILCAAGSVLALTANHGRRSTATGRAAWSDPAAWGVVVALVKPPVGLALVLVLLCTRRAGAALRGLALTTLLDLPIALVVVGRRGLGGALSVLRRCISDGDGATAGDPHFTRIDVVATVGRLVAHPSSPLLAGCWLAVAVACLALGAHLYRTVGELDAATMTTGSLAVVLLTPNLHYAMVVLLPAALALVVQAVRSTPRAGEPRRASRRDRVWSGLAAALLVLPLLSPVRASGHLGISPQNANLVYALSLLAELLVLLLWQLDGRGLYLGRQAARRAR